MSPDQAHDPLQPHSHDPNPDPPGDDASFVLTTPAGEQRRLTPHDLDRLPQLSLENCTIVSTGHGASGPFTFSGVLLRALIESVVQEEWTEAEIISGDGFGTRLSRDELEDSDLDGQIILATRIDRRPLTRQQGLVRLIVPTERDDALRQVKWIAQINIRNRLSG